MFIDVTKYNLIRQALVSDESVEHDKIIVPPRVFALKKVQPQEVIDAAMEILQDRRVLSGITPVMTIQSLSENPGMEVILYVLVCYAVAIQQDWLVYSKVLNAYRVNENHKEAREYVQDIHKTWVN